MEKILITSIGRTGTKSLAYFLNNIPKVACYHHKMGKNDLPFLFLSQLKVYSNITTSYFEKRNNSAEKSDSEFYIEVNPYFRFADQEVLQKLGWKKIFLVRHPKTYIESVYTRNLFTEDDYTLNQYPDDNDPFSEVWNTVTRFEKLCWYYNKVHSYLLHSNTSFFRFEELVKDSHALKNFVEEIGIDSSKVKTFKLSKRNTSSNYKLKNIVKANLEGKSAVLPSLDWHSLTKNELKTYEMFCGSLIKPLGYVL